MGRSGALLAVGEQGWGRKVEARGASRPLECGDESWRLSAQLKSAGKELLACPRSSLTPTHPIHPEEGAMGRISARVQLQFLLPTLNSLRKGVTWFLLWKSVCPSLQMGAITLVLMARKLK